MVLRSIPKIIVPKVLLANLSVNSQRYYLKTPLKHSNRSQNFVWIRLSLGLCRGLPSRSASQKIWPRKSLLRRPFLQIFSLSKAARALFLSQTLPQYYFISYQECKLHPILENTLRLRQSKSRNKTKFDIKNRWSFNLQT